jgi:hypothetical protein
VHLAALASPWPSSTRASSWTCATAPVPLACEVRCSGRRCMRHRPSASQARDRCRRPDAVLRSAGQRSQHRDVRSDAALGVPWSFPDLPPGCTPPPRPPSDLASDDRLSAFVHMDVLDDDGLLAARAKALKRPRQREGSQVQGWADRLLRGVGWRSAAPSFFRLVLTACRRRRSRRDHIIHFSLPADRSLRDFLRRMAQHSD